MKHNKNQQMLSWLHCYFVLTFLRHLQSKVQRNIRQDQVNLLTYGPDRPYFKQKQKKNAKNFGQLDFFNLLFSAF